MRMVSLLPVSVIFGVLEYAINDELLLLVEGLQSRRCARVLQRTPPATGAAAPAWRALMAASAGEYLSSSATSSNLYFLPPTSRPAAFTSLIAISHAVDHVHCLERGTAAQRAGEADLHRVLREGGTGTEGGGQRGGHGQRGAAAAGATRAVVDVMALSPVVEGRGEKRGRPARGSGADVGGAHRLVVQQRLAVALERDAAALDDVGAVRG